MWQDTTRKGTTPGFVVILFCSESPAVSYMSWMGCHMRSLHPLQVRVPSGSAGTRSAWTLPRRFPRSFLWPAWDRDSTGWLLVDGFYVIHNSRHKDGLVFWMTLIGATVFKQFLINNDKKGTSHNHVLNYWDILLGLIGISYWDDIISFISSSKNDCDRVSFFHCSNRAHSVIWSC